MFRQQKFWDFLILLGGAFLTLYVTFALFGFVRSSNQHYAFFVFSIMVLTSLVTLRDVYTKPYLETKSLFWRLFLKTGTWLVCLIAITSSLYIFFQAERLEVEAPFFSDQDFYIGLLFTISVVILTRIHWGWVLAGLLTLGIVYFFYGHLLTNPLFTHPYLDPKFVMNYIGLGTTQGFFWFAQSAVDDIYYLIIYASLLFGIGSVKAILEAGKAMGNRVKGGAAGPAIIGSGLTSMVMGVAVSNVVLTGRFTIPMMKKYGYSPSMAAAIEAAASTSGQIMPPVLGLAAFIIASFLSMKYIDIVMASVYPAILYMTGITVAVAVYALSKNLPRLKEVVDSAVIYRTFPSFVISFIAVCVLLVNSYSPSYAGFAGCCIALLMSLFQGADKPKLFELRQAFLEGFEMLAILSLLLIAIGPLGQVFLTTNLSGRIGIFLISVLPESKFILLVGTAVLCIILGMGLPTPVAYLIVALAIVPFMQEFGVTGLVAHFFIFYFAVFSALTPPVAVAALAGAKIADASFWDTCVNSLKLASTTFIIPFAFVYRPELMSFPNVELTTLFLIIEIIIFQIMMSSVLYGYLFRILSRVERMFVFIVSIIGFVSIISGSMILTSSSLMLVMICLFWFFSTRRKILLNY